MNEQKNESTLAKKGGISVETAHIFPVIKKWLYSEKDIFLRELVSNAADAVTKHKRLCSLGQAESDGTAYRIDVRLDASAKTLTVSDNGHWHDRGGASQISREHRAVRRHGVYSEVRR